MLNDGFRPNVLWLSIGTSTLMACSSSAPEPTTSDVWTPASRLSPQSELPSSGASIPGFVQSPARSKFSFGKERPVEERIDPNGLTRLVGADGVVVTDGTTGGFVGVPNSTSASAVKASLFTSGADHNIFVRDYFLASGLPANQLGELRTHVTFRNEGTVKELWKATSVAYAHLQRFTTVITRSINGYSFPDSYAWASFDIDGYATAEEVYWPPVPASVLDEAADLAAKRTTLEAQAFQRFGSAAKAAVVVRHSGWREKVSWSRAVLDVAFSIRGTGVVRHLDASGTVVVLPNEEALPMVKPQK